MRSRLLPLLLVPVLFISTAGSVAAQSGQSATSCAQTYVVQRGDGWYRISSKTKVPLKELLAAANATLSTRLHPGMVVCVKTASVPVTTPTTTPPTTTPPTTTPPTTTPPTTTTPPSTTVPVTPDPTVPNTAIDPIRDARNVIWPGPRQVAITFDDGPLDPTTKQILDVLDVHKVPATFFVTCNRISRYRPTMDRMAATGHSVQNHTMTHPWLVKLNSSQVRAELSQCSSIIEDVTGVRPTAYRPPFGAHSPRVDGIAAELGMATVKWNSGPASMTASTSSIVQTITGHIASAERRGTGLVILLHDGSGNRPAQVAALGPIIQRLNAGGWEYVKIG